MQQLVEERRKAGLAQAKALKQAQSGFFGDISVEHRPPDPAKEEPPRDEPITPEEVEIEAAYASAPPTAADVAALEEYSGSAEGFTEELDEPDDERPGFRPVIDLDAPIKAAEAALHEALGLGPEHEVVFDRRPLVPDDEPLGPDSFGGEDGLPAPSAETLRQQIAEDAERLGAEPPAAAEAAQAPVLAEGMAFETLEVAGTDAVFLESKTEADIASAPSGFALFGHNLFGDENLAPSSGPLSDRFKMPPFTVFDARQGIWQDRKRAWLALGIQSEVGRGENLLKMSDTVLEPDPVKRAEMVREREKAKKHAFGQDFVLGAQPGVDGKPGGQGKAWHTNDTGLSRKLAPGGGGGGAWIGGPKTGSSEKFGRAGEADVVTGEDGQPLAAKTGTSIFDPVLTELVYSWFVPPSGMILDPFAGGSVRGIVASKLGRKYVGIELRPEQIAANEAQAEKICAGDAQPPLWIEGDSCNARELVDGVTFDFLMACPPYGDLEQYSDDPRDLSTMTYEAFALAYTRIIAAGVALLKPDRFACYVIGDIRDDKGFYRGLPELTVKAFEAAGARKYNEAILVTAVGSLPIRITKQFNSGRKLGKTHQNCLVFVKGDPKAAAEACNGQMELPA